MKIILDAMGGDFAPEAPVLGAIDAAKAYGAQITLVGRGEEILEVLGKGDIYSHVYSPVCPSLFDEDGKITGLF